MRECHCGEGPNVGRPGEKPLEWVPLRCAHYRGWRVVLWKARTDLENGWGWYNVSPPYPHPILGEKDEETIKDVRETLERVEEQELWFNPGQLVEAKKAFEQMERLLVELGVSRDA